MEVGLFSQVFSQVIEQEETAFSCARRGSHQILWKISSPKGMSSTGRGCSGKWWHHHSWN